MKQQEIFLLTAIGLLVSSKDVLASEKLDYVRLATLERDNRVSSWLISRVISLPELQVEREVQQSGSQSTSKDIRQPQNRTYKIAPGDTLEILAKKFQTTVSELASSNGIKNPNYIFVGQTLVIPKSERSPNPEKMKEIDVTALVRQKNRSLPLPPPIRRKNFSSSSAARGSQMGELGALPTRPLKFMTSNNSDYQQKNVSEMTTSTDKSLNFVNVASIASRIGLWTLGISLVGATWFGFTSLSWAGVSYSFQKRLEVKPLSSKEVKHFTAHLQQASSNIFWMTICIGSFAIFICLIIGGTMILVCLLGYTAYCLNRKFEEADWDE